MTARFQSTLSSVAVPAWVQLPSGVWVTAFPLVDADNDVIASFTYARAQEAARAFGARLINAAEVVEIHHAAAVHLRPVTLPSADMLAAGMSEDEIQAIRVAHMNTLEWSRLHTDRVRDQLRAAAWDGHSLVENAGKHWLDGAPAGRAWLAGWWNGTRFIQPLPLPGSRGPHGATDEMDYGTSTMLARAEAP